MLLAIKRNVLAYNSLGSGALFNEFPLRKEMRAYGAPNPCILLTRSSGSVRWCLELSTAVSGTRLVLPEVLELLPSVLLENLELEPLKFDQWSLNRLVFRPRIWISNFWKSTAGSLLHHTDDWWETNPIAQNDLECFLCAFCKRFSLVNRTS